MNDVEIEIEKIRSDNERHLEVFKRWLENQGLKEKTISQHIWNVDFYINDYLCYYDPEPMSYGLHSVENFFGYWFIRKAMWSSKTAINSTVASIKKFYKCMMEQGAITEDEYNTFLEVVKRRKKYWLREMEKYDQMVEDEYENLYCDFDDDEDEYSGVEDDDDLIF